jgi:hypothetical protein
VIRGAVKYFTCVLLQFEELGKNRGSERSVRGIEVGDEEEGGALRMRVELASDWD